MKQWNILLKSKLLIKSTKITITEANQTTKSTWNNRNSINRLSLNLKQEYQNRTYRFNPLSKNIEAHYASLSLDRLKSFTFCFGLSLQPQISNKPTQLTLVDHNSNEQIQWRGLSKSLCEARIRFKNHKHAKLRSERLNFNNTFYIFLICLRLIEL